MEASYGKILKKLSKISSVSEDEIDRRVETKRNKLSGLISREGALQVIAAELGISFDNEKLKIEELLAGMRKVNFSGRVIKIYPIRTFTTKSGDIGKVVNMVIADETSNIKVVLWDTNHIFLIESGEISEGGSVEIVSGSMRQGEVHLGSFSEIKSSSEKFLNVQEEKLVKEKEIFESNIGDKVKTRAFVVQSFNPRFFEANKETGKKASVEELSLGIPTEKRAILNIVIDDGTENIRAVLFHEVVKKIGLTEYENSELLNQQRENLLGKEFVFFGDIRMNSFFNNPELVVENVETINLDKLIESLEKF